MLCLGLHISRRLLVIIFTNETFAIEMISSDVNLPQHKVSKFSRT